MRRILLGASTASVCVAAMLASAQQQFPTPPTPQHPIFRAGSTLVAVDIYPTKDGQVVAGLTPADFEIKEDGKPQTVEFFEFLKFETSPADSTRTDPNTAEEGERLAADPHHRAFVAYFDTYHLTSYGTQMMRTPVVDFLQRTIGSTDYFAAMNPDVPVSRLTFGQRTETIAHDVDEYWPLAAETDARTAPISAHEQWLQGCFINRWPDVKRDQALVATLYRRWRMDVVLQSLNGLVAKLGSIREERTNVLLFADGWSLEGPIRGLEENEWNAHPTPGVSNGRLTPNGANREMPDSDKCDAELARLAELDFQDGFRVLHDEAVRKNVAFDPISPAGLEAYDDNMMRGGPGFTAVQGQLDVLRTLASTTSGQSIVGTNDIRTPMKALADGMSSYYLAGYYTTNTNLDGKYRTIDVKVKPPGLKVSARHGYVASANPVVTTSAATNPTSGAEQAALDTLARLETPEAVLTAGAAMGSEVVIVVEVQSAQAPDIAGGADVTVTLTAASGAAPVTSTAHIDKGARSALVRLPEPSSPGPWEARVVVGAPDAGLTASLSVAAPTASALVSDPILYRATPSPRSPLWPSASHRFTRNDRLHLEWTTHGALESHVARLLDTRGQPLAVGVALTEPPNAARPTLAGDVSLAPLAPGDYLLELVVGKGGATERHLVAIRIGT